MEIHELNTFSGTLGSGDYFATDNGFDTSKVSAEDMFGPLNTRIDNIIAGPASSAQEVIDARLGADGVTYPSLGDAIRDQVSDLKSDFNDIAYPTLTGSYYDFSPYIGKTLFGENSLLAGSGATVDLDISKFDLTGKVISTYLFVSSGTSPIEGYITESQIDENGNQIYPTSGYHYVAHPMTILEGCKKIRLFCSPAGYTNYSTAILNHAQLYENGDTQVDYDVKYAVRDMDTVDSLSDKTDTLEFALSSPFSSYNRKVTERYGPAILPISTIQGHKYVARFKTSEALTLNNFYLQIWQTQDITDPSTCIKNFGNVWGSEDTSNWLEYRFTADGVYNGYFRFGWDIPTASIPLNVVAIGELYDVTDSTIIHVNDLENRIDTLECSVEYWKGKKIVWFGTSIPAGVVNAGESGGNGAYPTRIGQMLGATVYNESVGSSQVRAGSYHNITADDPMGYGGCSAVSLLYSLSLSSSEKQDIIDNWNSKWSSIITWFGSLVDLTKANEYKASSWDVKLTKYLTGGSVGQCDLYVFDHGYNDGINQRGFTDLSDVPANAEDRTYFLGAMQFLIDKILADNPKAKILFIGHYCTDGRSGNFLTKYVTDAQEKLAEIWQYPLIETWKYMGFNHVPITVDNVQTTVAQQWMPDDLHPSSDTTGEALKHYAEVLYPLVRDVR